MSDNTVIVTEEEPVDPRTIIKERLVSFGKKAAPYVIAGATTLAATVVFALVTSNDKKTDEDSGSTDDTVNDTVEDSDPTDI